MSGKSEHPLPKCGEFEPLFHPLWLVPARGLWGYPKCWFVVRGWGNHDVGGIRDDDAQVSQCASAQVSVDCSRVFLEKLSGDMDCLLIRLALNCW
jgi:hypothetical protein